MLTQNENVPNGEIWADEQFSRVLNYLTGERIYTNGSLRLVWLGAPYVALYNALVYEKDGGPIWVMHTEEKTGILKGSHRNDKRDIFAAFSHLWLKQDDTASQKWGEILGSMAGDHELW